MSLPWYQEPSTDETQILSSRIRFARNIKKYPFHQKLSIEDSIAMLQEARDSVALAGDLFHSLDISSLGHTEQSVFLEKHIVSPQLLKNGLPKGLLISDDQNISIMLNEEDHLRIQSIQPGEGLAKAFETANKIDDLIEERVEFAFHPKYGYLTACPTNVGTGMRASYMIHLPCLDNTETFRNTLPEIAKFGIILRGIYGEGTGSMGSIYQISNQNTLGKSESEIIEVLQNVTTTVITKEMQARESLILTRRAFLEDKIYRAYAILSHSRKISAKEAIDLLSSIRLGYLIGILEKPRPVKQIYQIMMEIQPGHLQRVAGAEMSEEERDVARAKYLRSMF